LNSAPAIALEADLIRLAIVVRAVMHPAFSTTTKVAVSRTQRNVAPRATAKRRVYYLPGRYYPPTLPPIVSMWSHFRACKHRRAAENSGVATQLLSRGFYPIIRADTRPR